VNIRQDLKRTSCKEGGYYSNKINEHIPHARMQKHSSSKGFGGETEKLGTINLRRGYNKRGKALVKEKF